MSAPIHPRRPYLEVVADTGGVEVRGVVDGSFVPLLARSLSDDDTALTLRLETDAVDHVALATALVEVAARRTITVVCSPGVAAQLRAAVGGAPPPSLSVDRPHDARNARTSPRRAGAVG